MRATVSARIGPEKTVSRPPLGQNLPAKLSISVVESQRIREQIGVRENNINTYYSIDYTKRENLPTQNRNFA
jgi:hypothetical protein